MSELQNIAQLINQAPLVPEAAWNLALERFRYREWDQAVWYLKEAAKQGNTAAKAELAALHIRGLRIPKDEVTGYALLAECNGIIPELLTNDPVEYGNSFDEKVRMRVVIEKHVYDERDIVELSRWSKVDFLIFELVKAAQQGGRRAETVDALCHREDPRCLSILRAFGCGKEVSYHVPAALRFSRAERGRRACRSRCRLMRGFSMASVRLLGKKRCPIQ